MDVIRSESSRHRSLAISLDLIAGYERDQSGSGTEIRSGSRQEEIRRECDFYRREARRVWEIRNTADRSRTKRGQGVVSSIEDRARSPSAPL